MSGEGWFENLQLGTIASFKELVGMYVMVNGRRERSVAYRHTAKQWEGKSLKGVSYSVQQEVPNGRWSGWEDNAANTPRQGMA